MQGSSWVLSWIYTCNASIYWIYSYKSFFNYKIELNQIIKQTTKIIGQSKVEREPYEKKVLVDGAIYYNEEAPFVLLSETIDVKYDFWNNASIRFLII